MTDLHVLLSKAQTIALHIVGESQFAMLARDGLLKIAHTEVVVCEIAIRLQKIIHFLITGGRNKVYNSAQKISVLSAGLL